ncbi:hypothetical protein NM688_g9447 [Phlebia brevispora]|uniref:Uncharacterized protein n=1 Tax=Phlebia brevispora TaxID=194682 RepID=A0ACC1RJ39_9APHY|nr:hypothetical protein NM688_g9447 [Phlebia brevispora]
MASEETPLLSDQIDSELEAAEELAIKQHEAVYNRFSSLQKRTIVSLISLAGLSPLLISGVFIPSIPQIARDLNTTGAVVKYVIIEAILYGKVA